MQGTGGTSISSFQKIYKYSSQGGRESVAYSPPKTGTIVIRSKDTIQIEELTVL